MLTLKAPLVDVRSESVSEGLRTIKVKGAEAEYEIGRVSGGYSLSCWVRYSCGDCHGYSCRETFRTREECLARFLAVARRHFNQPIHTTVELEDGEEPSSVQLGAQKRMLRLLEAGGLFGFVEPEPSPIEVDPVYERLTASLCSA